MNTNKLLEKFEEKWGRIAQVKKSDLIKSFDCFYPDFDDNLIPIINLSELSDEEVSLLRSIGWIIYNNRTIDIENKLISPFCMAVLSDQLPFPSNYKELLADTLIDESFHIRLSIQGIEIVKKFRGINISLPESSLAKYFKNRIFQNPSSQILIQMAASIASETMITDYLDLLSSSNIQPYLRQIVVAHKKDEAIHDVVFSELSKEYLRQMDDDMKVRFAVEVKGFVDAFKQHDYNAWRQCIAQVNELKSTKIIFSKRNLINAETGITQIIKDIA